MPLIVTVTGQREGETGREMDIKRDRYSTAKLQQHTVVLLFYIYFIDCVVLQVLMCLSVIILHIVVLLVLVLQCHNTSSNITLYWHQHVY